MKCPVLYPSRHALLYPIFVRAPLHPIFGMSESVRLLMGTYMLIGPIENSGNNVPRPKSNFLNAVIIKLKIHLLSCPHALDSCQRVQTAAAWLLTRVPARLFIWTNKAVLFCRPCLIFTFIFDRTSDASRPAYFSNQVLSGVIPHTVDALLTLLCALVNVFVGKQSVLHPSMPCLLLINIHQLILD